MRGVSNPGTKGAEEIVVKHERLLTAIAIALVRWAMDTEGAVDFDVREALEALVRTQRTLSSGLYYESRPENRIAASLFDGLRRTISDFREAEAKRTGLHTIRDSDVLELLSLLQELERVRNNGRKRGRAFIESLTGFQPEDAGAGPSPLVLH